MDLQPWERRVVEPIGAPMDVLEWDDALARISGWARAGESRYVCICNAHSVVTASNDPAFMRVIREADMATPDGAPVAWLMRKLGAAKQERINGPDLMMRYCELAAASGEPIYLYGNTEPTLAELQVRLKQRWPGLVIAGAYSPPFRATAELEDPAVIEAINASGARTVWVSLGCPKQEMWMARHRGKINAVMLGVGAAFDYHAGTLRRAPRWMRAAGLEWLHRLVTEPRRLWRRYLFTNSAFIVKAASQLLRARQ